MGGEFTRSAGSAVVAKVAMVSASSLAFCYPGVEEKALAGISFDVGRGEVLGIVGQVGAGKTTLCMSLAGLVPRITGGDSTGDLEVAGVDPRKAPAVEMARRVGLVFEDYSAQLTQIRVLDEVMAPQLNRGVPRDEAETRAHELLERVGLRDARLECKRTWELSGGQQQRIAIAATLSMQPEVLVLDNVTGMLDPQGKEEVRRIIADLAGSTTLVVVENDADFLLGIADRLLVLVGGEVIALGPTEEILSDEPILSLAGVDAPVSLDVARALGLPNAPLTAEEFERAVGRVRAPARESRSDRLGSGEVLVCVEGATYRYPDGTTALDDVDLKVRGGEVRALIGGNGSGKTTLAKLVVGLLRAAEGRVLVDGADTLRERVVDLAWRVGIAFQNPDEQISERSVADELRFPLQRRRYKRTGLFRKQERYDDAYVDAHVARARELAGLEGELLNCDPSLLPLGRRRLVTTSEALVLDPSVVVLDEPGVSLDAASRRRIARTVRRLREAGKAVILIEHDMDLICEVADTVTVLERGRVVLEGTTREVFAEDNWRLLAGLHIRPPRAARLGRQVGVDALTPGELVAVLSSVRETS